MIEMITNKGRSLIESGEGSLGVAMEVQRLLLKATVIEG